jgi:hypothetical protein
VEIRDHNGTGEWSAQAVRRRYLDYSERYGHGSPAISSLGGTSKAMFAGSVLGSRPCVGLIRFSGQFRCVVRSSCSFLLSLKKRMGVDPVGNRARCGFP